MTLELVTLLVLAAVAAYVQTITGFALGLVMIGGIALTQLLPLADAAVLVSVLTLVNAIVVLARGWRDVAWSEFRLLWLPGTVTLVAGYGLLQVLAGISLDLLQVILGAVIVVSSMPLLFRPHPLPRRSPVGSFIGFGAISGLMGGMFSTSGPPLVYHLYRQPMPPAKVRETLVLIFATYAIMRLGIVGISGHVPDVSLWWSLLAVPAVIAFSYAAHRWPPPLSAPTLRRIVFILLALSGLLLGLPALLRLFGVL